MKQMYNRLIEDLPSNWTSVKLKRMVQIVTGNTPSKNEESNYSEEGVPWVKPDNLISDFVISDTKEKLSIEGLKTARIVPEKSALVCCIGSVGKVSINDECCTTNQQINSIIFDKEHLLDSEFGLYVTLAAKEEYIKHSNKVVVSILNKTDQGNIKIPTPPLPEQRIIARFLKQKTTEIDALIEDKEKLIELLEEKRQSIITETVTKGLNPNVEMKDSGVEWLGKIPEHWVIKKMKNSAELLSSNVDKKIKENENVVLMCNYVDVYYNDSINNQYDGFLEATATVDEINKFKLLEGDVIVTKDSESFDDIVIPTLVQEDLQNVICGYHLSIFRTNRLNLKGEFLYNFLSSSLCRSQYYPKANGVTRFGISKPALANGFTVLPPLIEQEKINNFLNDFNSYTKETISDINIQIDKLKEYRQSLIYEAVTGKIDVQEMVNESYQEEVPSS